MIRRSLLLSLLSIGLYAPLSAQTIVADSLQVQQTSDTFALLVDSSFVAGNQGRYAEAEQYMLRAIALHPQHKINTMLWNNVAGLRQLLGRNEEAIQAYDKALELEQGSMIARTNRARLFALIGEHRKAITDYSLLVASKPDDELYRYQRAMSYMLSQQYDLADIDLTHIIEHNPTTLKGRIGYALLETARGRYTEAERIYDYLLDKLPKSTEVYEGRARMYLARGMKGFALRDITKAFEYSGHSPGAELYKLRAQIHRAIGEDKLANRDEKIAMEIEQSTRKTQQ